MKLFNFLNKFVSVHLITGGHRVGAERDAREADDHEEHHRHLLRLHAPLHRIPVHGQLAVIH